MANFRNYNKRFLKVDADSIKIRNFERIIWSRYLNIN